MTSRRDWIRAPGPGQENRLIGTGGGLDLAVAGVAKVRRGVFRKAFRHLIGSCGEPEILPAGGSAAKEGDRGIAEWALNWPFSLSDARPAPCPLCSREA